jgi:hypothetical protein
MLARHKEKTALAQATAAGRHNKRKGVKQVLAEGPDVR